MLNFGNKEFRNLQEQVLKNAQDIETLKGRENLQVVIVNELPEVGNPNYIYLLAKDDGESPDVYDEYIWLEDEERYEKIGGVSIDLTNYVTLDSAQTISGEKTITASNYIEYNTKQFFYLDSEHSQYIAAISTPGSYIIRIARYYGNGATLQGGIDIASDYLKPTHNNQLDLGASGFTWKDLYLSGNVYIADTKELQFESTAGGGKYFYIKTTSNTFHLGAVGVASKLILDAYLTEFIPTSSTQDLGNSTHYWRNLYLTGNISDGANTVSVANIASKVTSTQAAGTFDSNGEGTILDGASISEGLYIFAYGNCQCFVRLTATMIQSSDVTPIRVACPMIVSGSPSLGWLHIAKSGSNLTISVKDSNDHVDSGYAWTLTKTNLL